MALLAKEAEERTQTKVQVREDSRMAHFILFRDPGGGEHQVIVRYVRDDMLQKTSRALVV